MGQLCAGSCPYVHLHSHTPGELVPSIYMLHVHLLHMLAFLAYASITCFQGAMLQCADSRVSCCSVRTAGCHAAGFTWWVQLGGSSSLFKSGWPADRQPLLGCACPFQLCVSLSDVCGLRGLPFWPWLALSFAVSDELIPKSGA